ncbi:MAG: hypothetical protein ISS19_07620 [Bacteroidales bacterium]|nr:hypothetical protein [Bacteroidales bacterium]
MPTNINLYDYGARFYDPQLGRFHTIDRYAEDFSHWSPYHYANNNPILNIDINGDSTYSYNIATGVLTMVSDVGGNKSQIVNFINDDGSPVTTKNGNTITAIIEGAEVFVTPTSQGTLVSAYDPVADLPEGYNSESGYEYTAADLVTRHKLKGTSLGDQVAARESSGNAGPVAGQTAYREYVEKWGTDKAFWYGLGGGYFGNLLPGSTGALSRGSNALTRSANRTVGRTFSPAFGKAQNSIKNSWNAFLHANKGSGKSIQQLSREYQQLMYGR